MKIVMLSKALTFGAYQKKLEELARIPGVDLLALVPPVWHEPNVGAMKLERRFTDGYRLETIQLAFNGRHHAYFFRGLGKLLARERPDVLHIDEESFNPATFLAMRLGVKLGARCCFYNWANNARRYPPPFAWFEQYTFRHAAYAIVGNQEAADLIQSHGYQGRIAVLPQFGIDPNLFAPKPASLRQPDAPFTVGYIGRFIQGKGILDLLDAVIGAPSYVKLLLVGDGELRAEVEQRIKAAGIGERVTIRPYVGSTEVPAVLQSLDTLVLPSRTTPNWKEQFGRVLVEAMSCRVPVIGSSSGEIPNVIGSAGLIFPEGDVAALRAALMQLATQPDLAQGLAEQGRTRALEHYTMAALAQQYYRVYQEMLG